MSLLSSFMGWAVWYVFVHLHCIHNNLYFIHQLYIEFGDRINAKMLNFTKPYRVDGTYIHTGDNFWVLCEQCLTSIGMEQRQNQ